MDTIYMLALDHEYEGSNGYWTETYPDETEGYFTTREDAQARLDDLQKDERTHHEEKWRHARLKPWEDAESWRAQVVANNAILEANGGVPGAVPHTYVKPVMPEWETRMSDYSIIEIEAAK